MQLIVTIMNATEINATKKSGRPRGAISKFPGITKDAKELKVHRLTLYKMLSGCPGFELKSLRKRYDALLQTKPAELRNYINSNKAW